jgi:hypothetical protein
MLDEKSDSSEEISDLAFKDLRPNISLKFKDYLTNDKKIYRK